MVQKMIRQQTTIAQKISLEGVGLHKGEMCKITLMPEGANKGIVFEFAQKRELAASWRHVVDTHYHSCLGDGELRINLIEHMMASFAGLGIDNLRVRLHGLEIPIMDGSAQDFVTAIFDAGIQVLDAPAKMLIVTKKIELRHQDAFISLEPYEGFIIDYDIEFPHKMIGHQHYCFDMAKDSFVREIAPARTFGRYEDWDMLRAKKLALGASTQNAIVLKGDGILNEEGLRFEDEFVRHKILDCMGDLYLSGAPMRGRVRAKRAGHFLHWKLLKKLFNDDNAYRLEY